MGANYTEDELISLLKHTQLKKNLVVEGTTDNLIYRKIEASTKLNILVTNGRIDLLKIYQRRSEILGRNVFFLADQDFFLFFGIPEEYNGIIWTTGYSIENDIITGSNLEDYFQDEDAEEYRKILAFLCDWFAFILQSHIGNDGEVCCNKSLFQTWNRTLNCPSLSYLQQINYSKPVSDFITRIQEQPLLNIRGKNILDLFHYILSQPGRITKYNSSQILDICLHNHNSVFNKITIPSISKLLQDCV